MSADADLSAGQFMPTEEVGYMASGDWGGTVEHSYQRQVGAKAAGYGDWPVQQQELNADIKANGIREPVERGSGNTLKNGHHRYYAARENGITSMPYRNVP